MFFHQRFVPGLAIYSYIVADEKTKEAAVIDPTRDVDEFIEIENTGATLYLGRSIPDLPLGPLRRRPSAVRGFARLGAPRA